MTTDVAAAADRAGDVPGRPARPAARGDGGPPRRRRRPIRRDPPLGILFSAPYLVFWLLVFAWPIVFAVWMSFHDYFFAAPGADVDRPFVGLENYIAVVTDPDVWQSFRNVGVFLL